MLFPDPNFTLDGHSKGANYVDYFTGDDNPYLITGSDDQTAEVCHIHWVIFLSAYMVTVMTLLVESGLGLSNEKLCSNS
jgi:hypothetical protein